ncbi:MAG TPA: hypothetical protein VF121_09900 [Thermoanaerobaculia bacterium]|nr:hypothetical protein [Thermoanaerobaculia bacterium]
MKKQTLVPALAAAALALALCPPAARAQDGRFDLGLRGVIVAADGEPANDIPGYGLFGHYRLSDRWNLGFAADVAEYDFEQPARILGLQQDPGLEPIDVLAESTTLSAWIERLFGQGRTEWFLGAGLGLATIDVPDAAGPLAGGGRFDIATEADDEIVASLLGGVRRRVGQRLALELALRADQHLADWQLRDRVSGRTGAIDDYLALGGHFGVSFRF